MARTRTGAPNGRERRDESRQQEENPRTRDQHQGEQIAGAAGHIGNRVQQRTQQNQAVELTDGDTDEHAADRRADEHRLRVRLPITGPRQPPAERAVARRCVLAGAPIESSSA
jgi:hypothetical protein